MRLDRCDLADIHAQRRLAEALHRLLGPVHGAAPILDIAYRIYLTADHGNVEAEGIGRLSQGVVSELRGERVRAYRSAALAASAPEDIDAFRFDLPGLPPDFLPLYAGTRGAFVSQGDQVVAHGGISVEELIVPFVKVSIENEKQ